MQFYSGFWRQTTIFPPHAATPTPFVVWDQSATLKKSEIVSGNYRLFWLGNAWLFKKAHPAAILGLPWVPWTLADPGRSPGGTCGTPCGTPGIPLEYPWSTPGAHCGISYSTPAVPLQ